MRKNLIAWAAAGGIGIFAISSGLAAPIDGGAILRSLEATSPVQDARLFCANKYTGRFLYWGYCRPVVPRVYCMNRYTHRFLYWGVCRR